MMYSQNELVRLLAGAALAAFAFNSLQNQKEIGQQGGVRFNCFVQFLQSEDEFYRCSAAFQVNPRDVFVKLCVALLMILSSLNEFKRPFYFGNQNTIFFIYKAK